MIIFIMIVLKFYIFLYDKKKVKIQKSKFIYLIFQSISFKFMMENKNEIQIKYYNIYEIYFHVKLFYFYFISINKIVFDNQNWKDRQINIRKQISLKIIHL